MTPSRQEAAAQEVFAATYSGDPDVFVPGVVAVSDHMLVSEWLDGIPIARIIVGGTTARAAAPASLCPVSSSSRIRPVGHR